MKAQARASGLSRTERDWAARALETLEKEECISNIGLRPSDAKARHCHLSSQCGRKGRRTLPSAPRRQSRKRLHSRRETQQAGLRAHKRRKDMPCAQRPVFPIHPRKAACCRPRHEPVTACHRTSAGLRRLAGQAWSALTCLPLRGQPRPVPAAQKAFAGSHLVPVSSPWLACGHLLHGCLCRRGIIASGLFAEPLAPGARRAKAAPDPAIRHGERG